MIRVWHPYWDWEDLGMWESVPSGERRQLVERAFKFTGDYKLYGRWMLKVVEKWPIACEHNLTDIQMNRRAWIGHAACHMATNCPEDVTREAWGLLTDEQRDLANNKADEAIAIWEKKYESQNFRLGRKMGAQGILEWDT